MLDEYPAYLVARKRSPQTVKLRTGYVRRLAAVVELHTATEADLIAFIDSDAGWSPNTRQTIVSSLRSFYTWAHRAGQMASNPAAELAPIRVPLRPARIAPDVVLIDAYRRADLHEKAMLLLGSECGLRAAEIAALNMRERTGRWLTVTGKGGQTRSVYTSPELADLLHRIEARQSPGYYFRSATNGHIAPSTVWRHVRKLTGLNTHSLRHRAGTTVYRRTGHDLRLAQAFLGHASPTTTAIYVHIVEDDLERASDATRLLAA